MLPYCTDLSLNSYKCVEIFQYIMEIYDGSSLLYDLIKRHVKIIKVIYPLLNSLIVHKSEIKILYDAVEHQDAAMISYMIKKLDKYSHDDDEAWDALLNAAMYSTGYVAEPIIEHYFARYLEKSTQASIDLIEHALKYNNAEIIALVIMYTHGEWYKTIEWRELLDKASHYNNKKYIIDYYALKYIRSSPLHRAVQDNNLARVQQLVEAGADIDDEVGLGWTTLYTAVTCGNYDVARFLLEHKAKITTSKYYDPLLVIATKNKDKDMIVLLSSYYTDQDLNSLEYIKTIEYLIHSYDGSPQLYAIIKRFVENSINDFLVHSLTYHDNMLRIISDAIESQDVKVVSFLAKAVYEHTQDEELWESLLTKAACGKYEIVEPVIHYYFKRRLPTKLTAQAMKALGEVIEHGSDTFVKSMISKVYKKWPDNEVWDVLLDKVMNGDSNFNVAGSIVYCYFHRSESNPVNNEKWMELIGTIIARNDSKLLRRFLNDAQYTDQQWEVLIDKAIQSKNYGHSEDSY
jgi:ankyrin repeat protein